MHLTRQELRTGAALFSALVIPFGVIGVAAGIGGNRSVDRQLAQGITTDKKGHNLLKLSGKYDKEISGGIELIYMGAVAGLGALALRPKKEQAAELVTNETLAPTL